VSGIDPGQGTYKNFYAAKLHFIFTNANLLWQKPQTQTF
jgi:hypothetical protein